MSDSAQHPTEQPQETVTIDVSGGQARAQEPPVNARFVAAINRYKENLLERPVRYDILSIIFTILVFIGGLVGYLTKGSVVSLVAGTIFAILLAFGTYIEGARRNAYPLLIVLFGLGAVMVYRFVQSFAFLPAGLIGLLTIIMFLRHCYLLYLRSRSTEQTLPQPQQQQQQQEQEQQAEE